VASLDALFTIAELSVALAGFSGVVIGIRSTRLDTPSRQDTIGIVHILTSSGAAMVFSLLPSALHAAGLRETVAWNTTSVILGVLVLAASTGWSLSARRSVPRYPTVFWTFIATGIALGAALLATTAGLVEYRGTLLPLTLLWLLLVSFVQFVTFLAVAWHHTAEPPTPNEGS
jgi:hypothetical protein